MSLSNPDNNNNNNNNNNNEINNSASNVARKPQMIISHKRNNTANTNRLSEQQQQQSNDANLSRASEDAYKRKMDRQRLKEYYARLKEQNGKPAGSDAVPKVSVDNGEQRTDNAAGTDQTHTSKEPHEDSDILKHGRHFKELLHDYNTLKVQEVDGLKDIKTNIYDNYYDLVKINNLLQENKHKTAGSMDKLNALINDLKKGNTNTAV